MGDPVRPAPLFKGAQVTRPAAKTNAVVRLDWQLGAVAEEVHEAERIAADVDDDELNRRLHKLWQATHRAYKRLQELER